MRQGLVRWQVMTRLPRGNGATGGGAASSIHRSVGLRVCWGINNLGGRLRGDVSFSGWPLRFRLHGTLRRGNWGACRGLAAFQPLVGCPRSIGGPQGSKRSKARGRGEKSPWRLMNSRGGGPGLGGGLGAGRFGGTWGARSGARLGLENRAVGRKPRANPRCSRNGPPGKQKRGVRGVSALEARSPGKVRLEAGTELKPMGGTLRFYTWKMFYD